MCGERVTWTRTAHKLLGDVLQMLSPVGHLGQVASLMSLVSVRHRCCEVFTGPGCLAKKNQQF